MKAKESTPKRVSRTELRRAVRSLASNYGVTALQPFVDDHVAEVFDVGCSSPVAVAQLVERLRGKHQSSRSVNTCLVLFVVDESDE